MNDQQPNPKLAAPTYLLYGAVYFPTTPGQRTVAKAMHGGPYFTEAEARVDAVSTVLGGGKAVGVIVRLDHGRDRNGERHVVHRINDGKAWWE